MPHQDALGSSATTTALAMNAPLYATAPSRWIAADMSRSSDSRQYPSARRQVSFSTDEEVLQRVTARPFGEDDCGW